MSVEYCPKCKTLKNMRISVSKKKKKKIRVLIRSYHCETCNSFVKSEETTSF